MLYVDRRLFCFTIYRQVTKLVFRGRSTADSSPAFREALKIYCPAITLMFSVIAGQQGSVCSLQFINPRLHILFGLTGFFLDPA